MNTAIFDGIKGLMVSVLSFSAVLMLPACGFLPPKKGDV